MRALPRLIGSSPWTMRRRTCCQPGRLARPHFPGGLIMRQRCLESLSRFACCFLILTAFAAAGPPAHAQVVNQIVYAAGYATSGDGSLCNPWTSASGTGGILEAISACTNAQLGVYRGC